MPFTESFGKFVLEGDTITCDVEGFTITATIEQDLTAEPPWTDGGHGPVSDWTCRVKKPGERVLCKNGGSFRYYNTQEAVAIAKMDGWKPRESPEGTPGQRAERAVEEDFQTLKAWCNDEWYYCGIVLSVSRAGVVLDSGAASLWRVAMNYPGSDNSHLTQVANELLDDALAVGQRILDDLIASVTNPSEGASTPADSSPDPETPT